MANIPSKTVSVDRALFEEAIRFVDRHSESWYRSGQDLLTRLRAAQQVETREESLAELVQDAVQHMGAWEYDDLRNWRLRAEAALTDGATPVRASTAEVVLPKTAESTASPVHPGISVCPYCQRVNGGHSLACSAMKSGEDRG